MSVSTQTKRAQKPQRHRRWSGRVATQAPGAETATPAPDPSPAPRRRRELGPEHDQALYTCSCGFVFTAVVSTTVGCPHCGGAQAW